MVHVEGSVIGSPSAIHRRTDEASRKLLCSGLYSKSRCTCVYILVAARSKAWDCGFESLGTDIYLLRVLCLAR
jgi:hypothetical protein